MTQFVRSVASEETFLVGSIHGAFASVQGGPEARNAVMATTTVELLSDSSTQIWEIAGILSRYDGVQEGQQFSMTPIYIAYANNASSGLCWSSTLLDPARRRLRDVSIPDNVRELCDCCFKGCKSLCRATFGCSSCLERIGVSCFERYGVEEVSIPDGVRELCDCCFKKCKSLRYVQFGFSSFLERIGVSCFERTGVEEVSIPDGIRELCGSCFEWCRTLRRVNFGSSSLLERIQFRAFPRSVSYLCDLVSVK